MKRQVADRLFLSSLGIVIVCVASFEPQALSYKLADAGGLVADIVLALLAGLSIVAFMDTVVNDMLPDRYVWTTPLGRRRGIWLCLALIFAGMAFVVIQSRFGYSVALIYFLYALRCVGVAFLDLYYEYRPKPPPVVTTVAGALGDE